MTLGWLTAQVPPGEVHVVPVAEAIEHSADDCVCGPHVEAVFRDDGTNGWLVAHHSLDGREADE